MDPKVAAFRAEYREQRISSFYRGWLHFAFTSLGSLAAIVFAVSQIRDLRAAELLVVPMTFLFANFVEFRVHRGPMHRRTRGLGLLFERHTLEHHRFFTETTMRHEGSRDFAAVLFPPVMLLFFLGGIATPVGAALWLVASPNIACLFAATAVGYFLNYEWLHFAYHQDERGWVAHLPFMERLRRLHSRHHDPRSMTTANFNITYPIFDIIFGTYRK
jgi:hypothetical protein